MDEVEEEFFQPKEPADAQTPLGLFKKASHLVRQYSCGDGCGGSYKYWFVAGVGIVKSVRIEHDIMDFPDGPYLIAGWELIDYHVAR